MHRFKCKVKWRKDEFRKAGRQAGSGFVLQAMVGSLDFILVAIGSYGGL